MAEANRETVRDALATLLTTTLVTNDEIVEAVYNYQIGNVAGESPFVTVSSAGSMREVITQSGNMPPIFYLTIDVFVIYASGSWTEDNAEDRLDLIERTIADVIAANSGKTANWDQIDYSGRTNRLSVVIGGDDYIREIIPVEVLVLS